MERPVSYIGARVKRVEDPRFILGKGCYVGDVVLPGMAHLAILRSPHAHARIKQINASAAAEAPGVLMVLTGQDLQGKIRPLRGTLDPEIHPTFKPCTWHPLAVEKVRHVGDPVALVVAENRYLAEDATELIEVDYETLEPLVDLERTLQDNTNLVHEEWGDNVHESTEFLAGDPDEAFASAHTVVRQRFRTNRLHPSPLEPRGCVAQFNEGNGGLTLWTSSQTPHLVRTQLSEHFSLPESKVRVISPDVGGGFGLKCHFFLEEALSCAVAMRLGRPVRWLEDRLESFNSCFHARDEIVDSELAVAADGEILAARLRVLADTGAYSGIPFPASFEAVHTALSFPGPYRLQNYAFNATSVATNKPTLSTYRGVGMPIATFVMEGLLDRVARKLDIDPVDIRRRNLIREEEFPYQGVTGPEFDLGGYHECLETAIKMIGYEGFRKEQTQLWSQGIYRGVGICCYNEETGLGSAHFHRAGVPISGYESANIKFDPSGHVTVFCGTHSHGQSHETTYAQLAADELGIPVDHVTVKLGDTETTPYGWGTWASRSAALGGPAVLGAAGKLALKIRRIAAHFLEVATEDIEISEGRAQVIGAPSRGITVAELARRVIYSDASGLPEGEEPGLEATHFHDNPKGAYSNATHATIVEVDPESGAVQILRYAVAEDCGRMINPMVVEGQICGGIAQGLGEVFLEHLSYDSSGQLRNSSFMDYLLPSAADVPQIEMAHIETPSQNIPGGFKGTGEGGTIASVPAIANAVADALAPFHPNITELPLTPERVHSFVRKRGQCSKNE